MSKSNVLETAFIEAVFGAGSVSPAANLYIGLHTGDPGEAGDQTTNEATFGSYARQAVAVPSGWTTGGAQAANANDISFPEATGGSESITHFSVGTALSGAGSLQYFGALTTPVAVTAGITVKFNAGNLVVTED
jgi:hypothetical protein